MGNSHPSLAPYQDFPTQDGNMLLAIGNDGQFQRFCAAAGQPQWASDERFATNTLRVKHRAELIPAMEAVTRTRTTADWMPCWKTRPCPAAPSTPLPRRLTTLKSRHAAWPYRCRAGRMAKRAMASRTSPAWPARCACRPHRPCCAMRRPALGQHTDEVLRELGLDADRIAALRAAKAI